MVDCLPPWMQNTPFDTGSPGASDKKEKADIMLSAKCRLF